MRRPHITSVPLVVVLTLVLVSIVVATLVISYVISYRATRRSLQDEALSALTLAADSSRGQVLAAADQKIELLTALLHSVELGCDISGTMNTMCAYASLRAFVREQRGRGVVLTYGRGAKLRVGPSVLTSSIPAQEVVFQRTPAGMLEFLVSSSDADSGLHLVAAFAADRLPAFSEGAYGTSLVVAATNDGMVPIGRPNSLSSRGLPGSLQSCTQGKDLAEFDPASRMYRALRHVPRMQACVVAEISQAQVLGPANRLRDKLRTLGLTAAAIAIAAAYLLALFLTWPIARLRTAIAAVKGERFDAKVPVVGVGELRGLSEAFAAMLQSVKTSRQALLESEERLRLAYTAANLWVWEHHLDTGAVLWRKPGSSETPPHKISFLGLLRLVHPEDRHVVCSALRHALEFGEYSAEYRMRVGTGRYAWIHAWGQVVHSSHNPARLIVGVSRDVTESRTAAEVQREKDRLAATAEMSGILAHEINNPLTSVLGAVFLLKNRTGDDPESQRLLVVAQQEGERVANISRQLLALHRPVENVTRVDLGSILEGIVDNYRARTASKAQHVVTRIMHPLTLDGYPDELRHALTNVFVNAVEVTPRGGTIHVRAKRGVSWSTHKSGVKITVADNGPGISAADTQRVWDAFASTKAERGTGLGLWVTRNVVLKHGGHLRLRTSRSAGRAGTCVSIYVPARQ